MRKQCMKKHKVIVGYDPGAKPGWGIYREGTLVAASPGVLPLDLLSSICHDADASYEDDVVVVIERPYVGRKSNPKSVITLAITAGRLSQPLYTLGCDVFWVEPNVWKGRVNKKRHQEDHILPELSPKELALLPKKQRSKKYDADMLDGVGLGLWQAIREMQR